MDYTNSNCTIQEDTDVKEIDIYVDAADDEEDEDLDYLDSNVNSANKQQTVSTY